jgi:hypothetical protein
MPHAQGALIHKLPHFVRQAEEAQVVGHGRPVLAHPVSELFLGEAELLDQGLEGPGGLHGAEVLALNVLDEGDLQGVLGACILQDGGDLLEAREPGGAVSPLPRDEAETAVPFALQENGLEHALFLLEGFLAEVPSRLRGARLNPVELDLDDFLSPGGDEGVKPLAKRRFHAASPLPGPGSSALPWSARHRGGPACRSSGPPRG